MSPELDKNWESEGNSRKRLKSDGSLEETDTATRYPRIQPPIPHHDEVFLLTKLRSFKRWQRKYCVITAGTLKLYKRSSDPYKRKQPQHFVDLAGTIPNVQPTKLRIELNSKETGQVIKVKSKAAFDRLLEQVHIHRSFGLSLVQARQNICKSYGNLSSLFASIVAKKEITSGEDLCEDMGRIIKDLEWISQTTASLTAVLEPSQERIKIQDRTGKRLFRFPKVPLRRKIMQIRQKIKKNKEPGLAMGAVAEANSFQFASMPDTVTDNLREYLTVQENFLRVAKLFVDKAVECMCTMMKKRSSVQDKLKSDFFSTTERARTHLEEYLNASQTVTMFSLSQKTDESGTESANGIPRMTDDEVPDIPTLTTARTDSIPETSAVDFLAKSISPRLNLDYRQGREDWDLYRMSGVWLPRRKTLPSEISNIKISLWAILKQCFGQNLTRISLPVIIFEPLNMLQVVCEELEYSWLLDKAAQEEDRCMRMAYIALFAVSRYKSTQFRTGRKPFNPLLGETFEFVRQDLGWRFIAEQVSHHPPVSASHAESDKWVFWQTMTANVKFWGRSVEAIPVSKVFVLLKHRKEEYSWNKAITCLHDILYDTRYYEHYGDINVTCSSEYNRQVKCTLKLKKDHTKRINGELINIRGEIYGQVLNEHGKVSLEITGNWTNGMVVNGIVIWKPNPLPPTYEKYYGFTEFALGLNEMPEASEAAYLPPTDTRYRPDQRLVELGQLQEAETKKQQLEELQRNRRKELAMTGGTHKTRWFRIDREEDGMKIYSFNDSYWSARERKFEGVDFLSLWE